MSTSRYNKQDLLNLKGRLDPAKLQAATEEQIAAWKQEDGIDDTTLGPPAVLPPLTDVQALRQRLTLSQEEFAARYMLSLRTVQEWEQMRREPSEAARVLLYAINQDPLAIARLLHPG